MVESTNVVVQDVTARDFHGSGIAYNASTGTIQNVHTENNGWHGINVDKDGANVTVSGTNTHDEAFADIYVDDDTKDVTVTAPAYEWERSGRTDEPHPNDRLYRLKTIEACNGSTFDSGFTNGSVNGQNGWKSTGSHDQEVTDNSYGYESLGCKVLRLSNANATNAFGDQTFSAPASRLAGESVTNDQYEAEFSFGSTKQSEQPGLALSISPDDGTGNRMSYIGLSDTATGIKLTFYDTNTDGNFVATSLGEVSRNQAHTIKFAIDFKSGESNDVVKVYLDGTLVHTGTTWEQYYRNSPEQASNGNVVPTVDRLLFRAGGSAVPANDGNGYVFDGVTVATSESDKKGPSIGNKTPANGATISGSNYKVSATVTDPSGVQDDKVYARFKDDSGKEHTYYLQREGSSDVFSKVINTKEIEDRMSQPHSVKFRAVDQLGNARSSKSSNVVIDNWGPSISNKTPAEGDVIRGKNYKVSAEVSDPSGVEDDSVYARFKDDSGKEYTYYLTREGSIAMYFPN